MTLSYFAQDSNLMAKLVCALSPESLRKKETKEATAKEEAAAAPSSCVSNGLPLSPSINFIDASMNESVEQPSSVEGRAISSVSEANRCKFEV